MSCHIMPYRDAPHWLAVQRASWAHPHGPDSSFGQAALQHPVVQVSHNDAKAYCKHVGQYSVNLTSDLTATATAAAAAAIVTTATRIPPILYHNCCMTKQTDASNFCVLYLYVSSVCYCGGGGGCTGKRLPTEKEWEFAARGGLQKSSYHWGDEHTDDSYKLYNGE